MKALVVILNKDNAKGLKDCLNSLVNQSARICEDFDVLILDGASKDDSEKIAMFFTKKYPCVSFRVQKKLGGTGFARVEGCEYAITQGYDAVIWGDSENYYSVDYVKKILRALEEADVAGGRPVVRGSFFAHAFTWYHAIHAMFSAVGDRHIPGNNRAEKVEIYKKAMYPESRRAEDYGLSLILMKKGIRLKHKVVEADVRVSLPESFSEVLAWQKARAIGAAEAAFIAGIFPYDLLIWLPALLPFPLLLIHPAGGLMLLALVFIASLVVFTKSMKFLERPRKRYFFAPFVGLLIHSAYNLLSLFHYLKLKIF
jgi:glycosyltransferase involved in cell wall biosynthesis